MLIPIIHSTRNAWRTHIRRCRRQYLTCFQKNCLFCLAICGVNETSFFFVNGDAFWRVIWLIVRLHYKWWYLAARSIEPNARYGIAIKSPQNLTTATATQKATNIVRVSIPNAQVLYKYIKHINWSMNNVRLRDACLGLALFFSSSILR